jgi:hypothetical protein
MVCEAGKKRNTPEPFSNKKIQTVPDGSIQRKDYQLKQTGIEATAVVTSKAIVYLL